MATRAHPAANPLRPSSPKSRLEPVRESAHSAPALVRDLASIIAAVERLAKLEDSQGLTRAAVEFARDTLGLERIGLYLVESKEPQIVMRGTWGTDDRGTTTDERGLAHSYDREYLDTLEQTHQRGELWEYRTLETRGNDRRCLPWTREDRDWLATTPLVASQGVVGVFYNDTAISRAPLDVSKQVKLAMFSSLLAEYLREQIARQPVGMLARLTRDRLAQHPLGGNSVPATQISRFINKVVADLEINPQLSGEQLAQRFRVSAGHLARTFKAEVGTSLVEYRNRLRLERFFSAMQAGQSNLNEAALQAGFGSYAQFIRVHRQITGVAPSEFSVTTPCNV